MAIGAHWAAGPADQKWPREAIVPFRMTDTTEVGILNNETPEEPEEVALAGCLTVIGQDDKPGKDFVDHGHR